MDRTHRDFAPEDIARIARAYHAWRGEEGTGDYEDVPGFCKSASLEEVRKHGYVLAPGRYVGAEEQEDDGEPFAEKMQRLTAQWREQQAEAVRLLPISPWIGALHTLPYCLSSRLSTVSISSR